MKIKYIKEVSDKTPLQIILEKVENSDLKDELSDHLESAKKDAQTASETWKKHAGDLEPGEVGEDAEDLYYLGTEGSGAYQLDGKTRWMPNCGPSVKVLNLDSITFVGKGAEYNKPEPEKEEDHKEESKESPVKEDVLTAVKLLLEAVDRRFALNGAKILDEAKENVSKLLRDK
jgi:hypothetical protein